MGGLDVRHFFCVVIPSSCRRLVWDECSVQNLLQDIYLHISLDSLAELSHQVPSPHQKHRVAPAAELHKVSPYTKAIDLVYI